MFDSAALSHHAACGLQWLCVTSLSAAGIAVVIFVIQRAFGQWMTPAWRYRLWGIVVVRLMLPALPSSPLSAANLGLGQRIERIWNSDGETHARPKYAPALGNSNVEEQLETSNVKADAPGVTVTVTRKPIGSHEPVAVTPLISVALPASNMDVPVVLSGIWVLVSALLLARLLTANLLLNRRLK